MKRILLFVTMLLCIAMLFGCVTIPKASRDLTITKMVYCPEEPKGFGQYVEKKDHVAMPSNIFWVYLEYQSLMETRGTVNLSGNMKLNNIKGVSISNDNIFYKIFKLGDYLGSSEQYLIGVIDKNGWIAIGMWSGRYNAEYELVITLTDGYSGKQATKSIWFTVANISST